MGSAATQTMIDSAGDGHNGEPAETFRRHPGTVDLAAVLLAQLVHCPTQRVGSLTETDVSSVDVAGAHELHLVPVPTLNRPLRGGVGN
jgi:hypothetical protein